MPTLHLPTVEHFTSLQPLSKVGFASAREAPTTATLTGLLLLKSASFKIHGHPRRSGKLTLRSSMLGPGG